MQENSEQGQTPEVSGSAQRSPETEQSQNNSEGRFQNSERRGPKKTHFEHPRTNTHKRNVPENANCPAEITPNPKTERQPVRPNRRFTNHFQEREPQKTSDGHAIRQPFDGQAHLYEVIQVRLVRTQRLVEVNTNGIRLEPNSSVLVRIHRNILLATTVGYRYRRVAEINSLPFVVRIASDEDKAIDTENAVIEKKAQELASMFAINQNLQMKVLSADLSHDHKNITINFASDVRVDFREMVAYLANQLKLRVEMYQLGLRNGTGIICGLGSCGQLLCCGRFLGQFDPIAVKQLRAQGLATNPKRISGVCGRLYCCMSYEYCDYMRERRSLPKKGKRIFTRWGIGRVTDIDMLREEVVVTYENGEIQRLTANDFVPLTEEIAANVEAGKYEFPLEPAKFYLNHDPRAAAEVDLQNRSNRSSEHSRHIDAAPKKSSTPHKAVRPVVSKSATISVPKSVAKTVMSASSSGAEQGPDNICLRRRHALIKHHDSSIVKSELEAAHSIEGASVKADTIISGEQGRVSRITRKVVRTPEAGMNKAETTVSGEQIRVSRITRTVVRTSEEGTVKTVVRTPESEMVKEETVISGDQNRVARMTRKVHPHQANLEEAMNANSAARNTPQRTSRRRYSPMNQPPEQDK